MAALVCTLWNSERRYRVDHDAGKPKPDEVYRIKLTPQESALKIDLLVLAAGEKQLAAQKARAA